MPLLSWVLVTGLFSAFAIVKGQNGRLIPEKRLGTATASYFPQGDHVTVQSRPLQVAGDLQNGIVLVPSFIVPGKKVVAPKSVNLQFVVDSPRSARPPLMRVQVVSEGKEVSAGIPRLVSIGKPSGGSVTRVLMYKMAYEQFLQMLDGKEIGIRLGHIRFDITEDQLMSLRDLQRVIAEEISFP